MEKEVWQSVSVDRGKGIDGDSNKFYVQVLNHTQFSICLIAIAVVMLREILVERVFYDGCAAG